MEEESKSIGEELSELLLRSYLISSTRKANYFSSTNQHSQRHKNSNDLVTSSKSNAQAGVMPTRNSTWSKGRFDALEQGLKQTEPDFRLLHWLPYNNSNVCADKYQSEIMEVNAIFLRYLKLYIHKKYYGFTGDSSYLFIKRYGRSIQTLLVLILNMRK